MKYLLKFVIVGLIIMNGVAYSNPPSPSGRDAATQPKSNTNINKSNPSNNEQSTPNYPPLIEIVKTPTIQVEAIDKTEKRRDYSSSEWWLVYLTGALAAITAVLAFFTYWLWKANAKLIESSRVQERAYLVGGGPAVNEKENTSMITIHNTGRTPGFITKVEWGLCDKDKFLVDVFVSKIIDEKLLEIMPPVEEDNVWPPAPQPVGMRHIVIKPHSANVGRIFFGRIVFDDIFGDSHYSTFKLELTKDGSRTLSGSYSEDWE